MLFYAVTARPKLNSRLPRPALLEKAFGYVARFCMCDFVVQAVLGRAGRDVSVADLVRCSARASKRHMLDDFACVISLVLAVSVVLGSGEFRILCMTLFFVVSSCDIHCLICLPRASIALLGMRKLY